jgi:hypothetical protein
MKVSQSGKSQEPLSAMTKLAHMRTATGKEDPELPAAEDKFIRVTSLRLQPK